MKKITTQGIFYFLLILITILGVVYVINYLNKGNADLKAEIKSIEAKNKLSEIRIAQMEQDSVIYVKALDSIQRLISEGKIRISEERRLRFKLEREKNHEISELKKLDDNDQVEYFISNTFQDYPVIKSGEYYLVNIKSIAFANNALVNIEYMEQEAESFIDEIQELNKQIDYYKTQVGILNAYLTNKNNIIDEQASVIANKNIHIALLEDKNRKLRWGKSLGWAIGGLGVVVASLN